MTAPAPTWLTYWARVTDEELYAVPELAELLAELHRLFCVCPHGSDVHPLEALRIRDSRRVLGFRLAACQVRYCRCRGGQG